MDGAVSGSNMCGRYTLLTQPQELATEFDLVGPLTLSPRYNIAPSQNVPVVRLSEADGSRRLDVLRWGLIPHWAKDPKIGYRTINARAETAATQPAFRDAFRKRRCLIPANGFYEWKSEMQGGKEVRQPYYIHRADRRPMGLAGLWDRWVAPDGSLVESFTIVTTDANEVVRPLHNRMPVILHPEQFSAWLDPKTPVAELKKLLAPFPPEMLAMTAVSRQVNSPRNDDPTCIDPLS